MKKALFGRFCAVMLAMCTFLVSIPAVYAASPGYAPGYWMAGVSEDAEVDSPGPDTAEPDAAEDNAAPHGATEDEAMGSAGEEGNELPPEAEKSRVVFDMTALDGENAYVQTSGRQRSLITADAETHGSLLADAGLASGILSTGAAQVLFHFVQGAGVDISAYSDDGTLYAKLYSGASAATTCTFEIGSTAANDNEEKQWSGVTVNPGWNEIKLPLSAAASVGGTCNLGGIVRLRVFAPAADSNNYILGDMRIYHSAWLPGNTTGDDETDVNLAVAAVELALASNFENGIIPVQVQEGSTQQETEARVLGTVTPYLDAWLRGVENTYGVRFSAAYPGGETVAVTFSQNDYSRQLAIGLALRTYAAMGPQQVVSRYGGEVIIADIVLGQGSYVLDDTGAEDATQVIQNALDNCAYSGGGTVWLPAGYYRITGMLEIPAFVTLRGDYQDPDQVSDPAGLTYGAILLADVVEGGTKPLVYVGGSAGAVGLTVYYPNQDLADVKAYPYVFYNEGQAVRTTDRGLHTIENCTLINAYRGIGIDDTIFNADAASSKAEQTYITNVKGTFLHTGVYNYNSSDNGGTIGFTAKPDYWADFTASRAYADLPSDMQGAETATSGNIAAYTRANAIGLHLGDLEGDYFTNVTVDSCLYGVQVNQGARTTFYGDLYDFSISNCETGIAFNALSGFGVNIACSTLTDNTTDIVNATPVPVKLAQVECSTIAGSGAGLVYRTSSSDLDMGPVSVADYGITGTGVRILADIDNTGATDVSGAIQAALTELEATGGVVYLPAGHYRMEAGVTVPANVELRGASPVGVKPALGADGGTVLEAFHEYGEDAALIRLAGANAGVSGLMITYPKQPIAAAAHIQTGYAVSGRQADGAFVRNCAITASSHGIYMEACDNYTVEGVTLTNYENNLFAKNCDGGQVIRCLQNVNPMSRNAWGYDGWDISTDQNAPYFTTTSTMLDCIIFDGSTNQTVLHWYAYRPHNTLTLRGGSDARAFNIGAGGAAVESDIGTLFVVEDAGSSLVSVNSHQKNRYSVSAAVGADVQLYNRMTLIGSTLLGKEGTYRNPGAESFTLIDGTDELFYGKIAAEGGYDLAGGGTVSCLETAYTDYTDRYDFSGYTALALELDTASTENGAVTVSLNGTSIAVDAPAGGAQTLYLDLTAFGELDSFRIGTFSVAVESGVTLCVLKSVRVLKELPAGAVFTQPGTGTQVSKVIASPATATATNAAAVINKNDLPGEVASEALLESTGSVWSATLNSALMLAFESTDISRYQDDGYIHFNYYVPEAAVGTIFRLELTSSGKADALELQYQFGKGDIYYDVTLQAGWNEIWLPISGGWSTGLIDLAAVNYIRLYQQSGKVTDEVFYVDGFEVVHSAYVPEGVISNDMDVCLWTDPDTLTDKGTSGSWAKADLGDEKYGRTGYGIANTTTIGATGAIQPARFSLPANLHLSDYSGGYLHIALYIEDAVTLANLGTLQLELCSNNASDNRELQWTIGNAASNLQIGWNALYFPLLKEHDTKKSAWNDLNTINYFRLFFETCTAATFNMTLADMYVTMEKPGPGPEPVPVTGITLDKSLLTLVAGASEVLTAAVQPPEATGQNIDWHSSDEAVATVDTEGRVTAKQAGAATITATVANPEEADSPFTAACEVTVLPRLECISFANATRDIRIGQEITITAADLEFSPAGAPAPDTITFGIDSNIGGAIAFDAATGKITGAAAGTATLMATATPPDGDPLTAILTVHVAGGLGGVTFADETGEKDYIAIEKNGTFDLSSLIRFVPDGHVPDNLVLTTSDSKKVALDVATGIITGKALGTADITVEAWDDNADERFRDVLTVKVAVPVTSLSLNATGKTLNTGTAFQLDVTAKPATATLDKLTWRVEGTSGVVHVSETGLVTAAGPGAATVKATGRDLFGNTFTAVCAVTVKQPAQSVSITDAAGALLFPADVVVLVPAGHEDTELPGDRRFFNSQTIIPVANPANTTDTVSVKSSSGAVAAVYSESTGAVTLTGVKAGSATITATIGKKKTTVKAQVLVPPTCGANTGVVFKDVAACAKDLAVNAGRTLELAFASRMAGVAPAKAVEWASSDPRVATVAKGKVRAIAPGSVTITATSAVDDRAHASITFNVVAPITSIKFNQIDFPMEKDTFASLSLTLNAGGAASTENATLTGLTYEIDKPDKLWFVDGGGARVDTPVFEADGSFRVRAANISAKAAVRITVKSLAKSATGYAQKTATLTVTVLPAAPAKATALTFNNATKAPGYTNGVKTVPPLAVGKVFMPSVSLDKKAANKTVLWDIAATDGNPLDYVVFDTATGKVTGKAPSGEVSLTVTGKPMWGEASVVPASFTFKVAKLVTGISIAGDRQMAVRGEQLLTPSLDTDASDDTLTWKSSNPAVVQVLKVDTGAPLDAMTTIAGAVRVRSLKSGSATITATSPDAGKKKVTFKITVVQQVEKVEIAVPSRFATAGSAALDRGQSMTLKPRFMNAAGTDTIKPKNTKVSWDIVSDPNGAITLSAKGVVKAMADGTAVVRITSQDSGETADLTINVTAKATAVALGQISFKVYSGNTRPFILDATTTPLMGQLSDGQNTLRWTIEDSSRLMFEDGQGMVSSDGAKSVLTTAPGVGSVKVKVNPAIRITERQTLKCGVSVTTESAQTKKIIISIVGKETGAPMVQGISIKNSVWLGIGKKETLKAVFNPAIAANKNLRWAVYTDAACTLPYTGTGMTVNNQGQVTAKAVGTYHVRAESIDGGFYDTCTVYVVPKN